MRIHQISLENFRNYEKVDLAFDESTNINLFLGDNAQGKTNFLEAITVLALAKSFRTADHRSLIGWNREYARIKGFAKKSGNELNLEFFVGKQLLAADPDRFVSQKTAFVPSVSAETAAEIASETAAEIVSQKKAFEPSVSAETAAEIASQKKAFAPSVQEQAASFRVQEQAASFRVQEQAASFRVQEQAASFRVQEQAASFRGPIKKNLKKNEIPVPVKDFIGEINIVLFHPEDLNMLYLSPSLRRKYLNTVLSQIDVEYFERLVNYNRILKQRNKLLGLLAEGRARKEELASWDLGLAENGFYIYKKRVEFVRFLDSKLSGYYRQISGSGNEIKAKYHATIDPDEPSAENYAVILDLARELDLRYRQTEKGVHRDDMLFYFDSRHISGFASRGEIRTLLIALKLAEIEYIEFQKGEKPVLLLDDVFSELDKSRQNFLLGAISEFQSFITATHIDFPLEKAKTFTIKGGLVAS